jgi:hypothetical protein
MFSKTQELQKREQAIAAGLAKPQPSEAMAMIAALGKLSCAGPRRSKGQ